MQLGSNARSSGWGLVVSMTVGLFFVPAAGAPAAVIATLAGSGALGRADGAASSATFMLPYGVAVGPDGTIFVTDYLAQSVRAIAKDGTVRTVAGGGKLIENGMKVQGGYADGPALQARFNGPTGIAVDASGRIFVADSANACIRVIESGSVRTFAGSPSRRAKVDGPIGGAGFWAPRARGFDRAGTLGVGDAIIGLRKISQGIVTTVPVPVTRAEPALPFSSHITSIAFMGDQLYLADGISLLTFDPDRAGDVYFTEPENFTGQVLPHEVMEWPGRIPAGYPFGIAAVDGRTLVYTDPELHAIRYRDATTSTALSRFPTEWDDVLGGGFGDGESGLVDAPLGIAPLGDGVVFADSGNRRIRTIPYVDTRRVVEDDRIAQPFGNPQEATRSYRILVVSESEAWWRTPFEQTPAAILESDLNRDRARLGLKKQVKVELVNMTLTGFRDYVREFVSDGAADAVVWEFNLISLNRAVPGLNQLTSPTRDTPEWQNVVSSAIRDIRSNLSAAKIPFFVVGVPIPYELPSIESTWARMTFSGPDEADFAGSEQLFAGMFAPEGARYIDMWPAFAAAELRPDRHPLFSSSDIHMSVFGQRLVGESLSARFEQEQPWRSAQ